MTLGGFSFNDHPYLNFKIAYICLVLLSFILLLLTLTTSGWGPGSKKILYNLREPGNASNNYGVHFAILLVAVISIGFSTIFVVLSFYKNRIVNNIVNTNRSLYFVSFSFGLSVGTIIWIAIQSDYSFGDLGYDYIILICASISCLVTSIEGAFLSHLLQRIKPDWRQDVNQCRLIQEY